MSTFFRKIRIPLILLVCAIAIGFALVVGLRKTVTLDNNGSSSQVTSYALRVSDLLGSQGVSISPDDAISPSLDTWLKNGQVISLVRAIPVQVLADGQIISIASSERKLAALLSQAGISLKTGDILLSNGQPVDPAQTIPLDKQSISLQVVRSVSFSLSVDNQTNRLSSAAPTLGSALWTAGYSLYAADTITPSIDVPLDTISTANLVRSVPLKIKTQFGDVAIRASAKTVADALQAAHLTPQGLDYSLPTLNEPIPQDGTIRLIRVTEQVIIEQTPIPFENEFQPVPDLELDTQTIVQPGVYGISAQRVRVRYEDGQEAARHTDSQWVALQPQPRITGYGTNVVMKTTTVDGVTIQYWRALTMYATSYHPSEVGDTTASGLPLKKGVVAVDRSIIPFYTQLYIPGYGQAVAADIGGGVHGRMIDLGYSDSDYVGWHSNVTVYFLWPPPANIVYVIP